VAVDRAPILVYVAGSFLPTQIVGTVMVCPINQGILEWRGFFLSEPDGVNTVDGADWKTQFASSAISGRNGVHELS
tara:strand:- start:2606 stop:2833 length:228 start_codon:yes stop_codon:yes gene_type:complete